MGSHRNLLLSVTIIVSFVLFHPPIYTVNAASKVVTDFCNQRKSTEDRAFCFKVFKAKPVSYTAKDNPALLKIALELAVSHARGTLQFMSNLEKDNATNVALKPVLKECISAYEEAIKEFDSIVQELEDDPPMASYDAHMASDELSRCDNVLSTTKVPYDPISFRHKIEVDYSRLCEEIADSF